MKARFLALAALVLGLASCQTEPEGLNVNVGGEVDTTITVTIPETETRAGNDTDSAGSVFDNGVLTPENVTMRYILEIYYDDLMAERQVKFSDNIETITFPVRLVAGRDYNFVVWADVVVKEDNNVFDENTPDNHYNTQSCDDNNNYLGLTNVTLNDNWDAMDESRDAFTGFFNAQKYSASSSINIPLTRPFAKLRVITTDVADLAKLGLEAKTAKVVYTTKHRTSFNARTGEYADATLEQKTHTYTIAEYDDNVANVSKVLFTDYFFAADQEEVVNFNLSVYEENGTIIGKTINFNTPIPARRNYLTTIQGNILTEGNNITVEVKDAFENGSTWNPAEDEYDVEVVDVFDTDSFQAALTAATTDVVINANGAEINLNYGLTKTAIPAGRTVTICNANVVGRSYGNGVDGTVIFENCTFNNATGAYSIHFDKGTGDVIFNNCDLYGWNSFGSTLHSVSFDNCTLTGNGTYALIRSYVALSLKDCVINITDANHTDNYSEGVEAVEGATMTAENVVYEVSNQTGLNYTLKAGAKNITLLAGEYELSELTFADGTYTLKGADIDNVVLKLSKSIYLSNKGITLENLTFNVPAGLTYNEGAYAFIHHATEFNMNNCVIDGGRLRLNVNQANIDKCQFKVTASSGFDGYGLYYYGNNNSTVNISNSTFTALQKAVVLYNEGAVTMNLNVDKCTFTASESTDKAAISIHSEWGINGNVNITNSSATGFANYNNGLWRDVNNNTGTNNNKFNVTVDGVQVQFAGYEAVANGLFKKGVEYVVTNAEGLAVLNTMMANKTAGKGITVNLGANIDFSGKTWTPVDSHVDFGFYFTKINGNGHTISNLTINGQAMFTRFAGSGNVTIKDVTFDNATVNSTNLNTSILTVQSYQNVLLDNVDVKNSKITGTYKVAPLIATVYNESSSTITATLKNCDVENTTVKATSLDFCTTGMVAFVNKGDNDCIEFENCTVKNVKLYAPNAYTAHAAIYTTGSSTLYNEAEGVTVENVTFENI